MKTIEVDVPVYKTKTVKVGTKKEVRYVTNDGKEFNNQKYAIEYEKELEYKKILSSIKIVDFEYFDFFPNTRWYYASTQEELIFILNHLDQKYCINWANGKKFSEHNFKVGDWITAIYEDGGDYRGDNRFYTLDFVKREIEEFLKSFEQKE